MPRLIKLPNGKHGSFPDDMSNQDIESVLQKQFPKDKQWGDVSSFSGKYSPTDVQQFSQGGIQGLENFGVGLADLIPGVHIKRQQWAPDTAESRAGEISADMSTYALPGKSVEIGSKAIPFIANGLKAIKGAMGEGKAVNVLRKLAGEAGTGALAGAVQNPEDKLRGAGIGAGLGAGGSALAQLMRTGSPIVNAIARMIAGGTLGYGIGGTPGAEYGAVAGGVGPKLAKGMGFLKVQPGLELLEHINPDEVRRKVEAGNAIGRSLTPGEATNNPYIAGLEAQYGKTGAAAAENTRIGLGKKQDEKNAINNLFNTIAPSNQIMNERVRKASQDVINKKTQALQDKVEPFYEKANTKKISPTQLKSITKSDETISNAIYHVKNDPAYSVELKDVPINSIKVLNLAKQKIDSDIGKELSAPKPNLFKIGAMTDSKNALLEKIDRFSPAYKQGRALYEEGIKPINKLKDSLTGKVSRIGDINLKNIPKTIFDPAQTDINVLKEIRERVQKQDPEAWNGIIRNEMQRLINTGPGKVSGSKFYNKIIRNDNVYNQFQEALKDNKKAKTILGNMKESFEHLINIESAKGGAGKSATGMSSARESVQRLMDEWNNLTGQKRNIEALKFINSPDWINQFEEIAKIKDKKLKTDKMIEMLAKIGAAGFTPSGRNN